jgi:hypothetical protein
MGTLDTHTPHQDSSLDLIMAMVHDPKLEGRFPNHAAFVSSDSPHFSAFVHEAAGEGRPIVVAFPGGGYMIVEGQRSGDALVGERHLA